MNGLNITQRSAGTWLEEVVIEGVKDTRDGPIIGGRWPLFLWQQLTGRAGILVTASQASQESRHMKLLGYLTGLQQKKS